MIDWQKVAEDNELTHEEFEKQILMVASCIGLL